MAFCEKCGARLEDGKACPSCGADNNVARETAKPVKDLGSKNNKDMAIKAGIVVMAAIIVMLLFSKLLGGGPEKSVKSLVKTMNKASCELSDYTDSTNEIYADIVDDVFDLIGDIDKDIKKDVEKELEDAFEDMYKRLEKTYGDDVKITYEVEDKKKIDKDDIEDIEENLRSIAEAIKDNKLSDSDELMDNIEQLVKFIGMEDAVEDILTEKNVKKVAKVFKSMEKEFSKVKVSKGYIITVNVEVKGDDESEEFKKIELVVLKVNGKWGVEPSSLSEFVYEVTGVDVSSLAEKIAMSIFRDLK